MQRNQQLGFALPTNITNLSLTDVFSLLLFSTQNTIIFFYKKNCTLFEIFIQKIHFFPFSLAGPQLFLTPFFFTGFPYNLSSFLFHQSNSQSILGFRNPMYIYFFLLPLLYSKPILSSFNIITK